MQIVQPIDVSELAALPDRIRLPFKCDPAPLLAEALSLPADAWTQHFVPDNYRGEWSVAPLRAPAGALHPILQITAPPGHSDWQETPYLHACPQIKTILNSFNCTLDAVRLMRLGPGSEIREHRDHDLSAEFGSARLHLPLSTSSHVEFRVNGLAVDMKPGECWYLRLSDPHAVFNRGIEDRIHLVVDVRVNEWLSKFLCGAASAKGEALANPASNR
jgi:hypothetical protein